MCQNCWISNTTESYNLKLSRNHKERIKRKLHFFLNSFSVDQIDIFFRVALSPFIVFRRKKKILQRQQLGSCSLIIFPT